MVLNKFKYILVILTVFACSLSFSQNDSLGSEVLVEKKNAIKFHFAFDARRSFVINHKAKFNGITVGIEVKDKHRFGLSFHGMKSKVQFIGEINKDLFPNATDTLLFEFSYVSFYYDKIWLKNKRWELSTPLHTGVGGINLRYKDTSGKVSAPFLNQGAYVVSLGGKAQYKVFRWFAFGLGGGYRMSFSDKKNVRNVLDAPYYQFQFKVLLGELYKIAFKKEELSDW